jgi:O-succinylbenzoate synthase
VKIDEVELRVIRVPFRTAFTTSFGSQTEKHTVIVTVRADGVEGYGEGVMETLPEYREETLAGALYLLREALVPALLRDGCADPALLADSWARFRGNPMCKTALELAVWDCAARQQGVALRDLVGGTATAIPVGASLGMNPLPVTLDAVARHVDEGYKRIKLKVEPGWDHELLGPVRAAHPDIELTVDANSAYTLDDIDTLKRFDDYDLKYIEQPLHWDDLVDHAALAPQLRTALCLDETLTSPARVRAALDLAACTVVNLKVGRVGGLAATQRIHALCVERQVPMWCGGMLETGIGRAHNIHVATLPGFTYPGDTASASRTYARDIVEQPLVATRGMLPVPTSGPGIGVTVDRAFLDEVTESVETIKP